MSVYSKANGLFDLRNSDCNVGSFLKKDDVKTILGITDSDLAKIEFQEINGISVIDESKLQKLWYENKIINAPYEPKSSLDEKILISIIQNTYPHIIIERQTRISRFSLDLKLTLDNKTVFIEFDGPSHFAFSRYGEPKKHPFDKKKIIEDKTGIEVVNWPYWIQRCQSNVKAIFEKNIDGFGVLWSTNIHFGDFIFDDSAAIIEKMSSRFNAKRAEGFGYFYINSENRNNPDHPIVEKIRSGKENINKLLPKGFKEKAGWLPSILCN